MRGAVDIASENIEEKGVENRCDYSDQSCLYREKAIALRSGNKDPSSLQTSPNNNHEEVTAKVQSACTSIFQVQTPFSHTNHPVGPNGPGSAELHELVQVGRYTCHPIFHPHSDGGSDVRGLSK